MITVTFEVIRAALLFLSIGLLVRQIAAYEGARNWLWWFITFALCGLIVSFLLPVLEHTNAQLLSDNMRKITPVSAVIGVGFMFAALVCLQVHIAGGREKWRGVIFFNLLVLSGITGIELML